MIRELIGEERSFRSAMATLTSHYIYGNITEEELKEATELIKKEF